MNSGPRERVNGLIAEVNAVSKVLLRERTSYASQLIPVQQYVTVSCIEAFLRYPEAIEVITAAMSPEELGARIRRPGCQADSVFLWGIANFFLIGRNIMGMVDPALDTVERTDTVLDFWSRVSRSYRGGGLLHAADGGNRIDAFDEATLADLAAGWRRSTTSGGPCSGGRTPPWSTTCSCSTSTLGSATAIPVPTAWRTADR